MTVLSPQAAAGPSGARRLAGHLYRGVLYDPRVAAVGTGVVAFAVATAVAGADGGYFPRTWGWIALALAWLAAAALVLRNPIVIGRMALLMLSAVAALVAWAGLSVVWADTATRGVPELERGLVYAAAVLAVIACISRRRITAFLYGLGAAILVISTYSLSTKLFPERLPPADDIARSRLAEPFGYPGAIGIFAGMGLLLALGVAAEAPQKLVRAVAGLAVVVLTLALYFSFSRGAAGACAIGLAVVIPASRSWLRQVTLALLLAPWAAGALVVASGADALGSVSPALQAVQEEGRHVALYAALAALGAAATAVAFGSVRASPSRRLRLVYAYSLGAAALIAIGTVFVAVAPPWTLVAQAADSFSHGADEARDHPELNQRFHTLSGNRRYYWSVAWDAYRAHPLLGSGAGTFQRTWLRDRPVDEFVQDAHSLYVEALSELGPLGLVLVLLALLTPLAGLGSAREHPLAAAAAGAFVAFVVHAGLDWDWEMPAVAGVGLALGAALVVCATRDRGPGISTPVRVILVGLAVTIAGAALASALGNGKFRGAEVALEQGRWGVAEERAHAAARWQPWAAAPWVLTAQAQFGQGRRADALASLDKALEKDDGDWATWLDLAQFSEGVASRTALRRAYELNPRSPEIRALAESRGVSLRAVARP